MDNHNHINNNPDNSLDINSTDSDSTIGQLLRNSYDNKRGLEDTVPILPENQVMLRGYQVLKRNPITNTVKSIREWNLVLDKHEIRKDVERFFEEEFPSDKIIVFEKASNDNVICYNRNHKYSGAYVYTRASLQSVDFEYIRPEELQSLEPTTTDDNNDDANLIMVGEIPENLRDNATVRPMLAKAGLEQNFHWGREEVPDDRFCGMWNCPDDLCGPLKYLVERVRELGLNNFLDANITCWLGESIRSARVRDYNSVKDILNMLECTNSLFQTANLASIDDEQRLQREMKRLRREEGN